MNWFRRLQWKLTFSYTLVTVGAVLIVMLALVAVILLLFGSDLLATALSSGMRQELVPEARTYLAQSPPDVAGLQEWADTLIDTQTEISLSGTEENSGLRIGNMRLNDADQQLFILDTEQTVLAQVQAPDVRADDLVGQPYPTERFPGATAVIRAALMGSQEDNQLHVRQPGGVSLLAVPIDDEAGNILGAILLTFQLPSFDAQFVAPLLQGILLFLIPITIGAGLIGALFGFLTSRGLVRRLRRMSAAADAWSQGDFTIVARDESGDELGQLSRRLNRMAEQLQNLMETRQELATLEERNRLARDLHDSVKQQVFATAMQLGAAKTLIESDPRAAQTHLAEAEQLARQSQLELTGLIQELRPTALEGQGLADALRQYVADWSRRTEIKAEVRAQGKQALPLAVEQGVFRVAQETLANVARHSQAQSVDVRLVWTAESFTLTIHDDGVGFDVTAGEQQGVGTQSMRERMQALNGHLTIESTPGEGTTVTAVIDLSGQDFL